MIANDFKRGSLFQFNGAIHEIIEYSHEKPGKGGAFVQAKIKNWTTGKIFSNRFRSGEKIEPVTVDRREATLSYRDGDDIVFMDNESYEETRLPADTLTSELRFLVENTVVSLLFHEHAVVGIKVPEHVILEVTEAPPGDKGDTSSGANKRITVETGYELNAPLFVNQGQKIKIDTRTGQYVERAN